MNQIIKVNGELWCSVCLKRVDYDTLWLSNNKQDGRHFCYDCAPDDAISAKDLMLPLINSELRKIYC